MRIVRKANSIGMFDFLKGLMMILIIIYHTTELYTSRSGTASDILNIINGTIGMGSNTAFFMIGGYSLRKTTIKRNLLNQWKPIWKPYIITGIARAICLLLIHFCFFGSLYNAGKESARMLLGSMLGLCSATRICGRLVNACGPMWFVLAMTIAACLLNAVLNLFSSNLIAPMVLLISILGLYLPNFEYFSILGGMTYISSVYIGYIIKKKKLLFNDVLKKNIVILGIILSLFHVIVSFCEEYAEYQILCGILSRRLFDLMIELLWGFIVFICFTGINTEKNLVLDFIAKIGRQSLNVVCIHTVEKDAIPWYLFVNHFKNHPFIGISCQLLIRSVIIVVTCYGIELMKNLIMSNKGRSQCLTQ